MEIARIEFNRPPISTQHIYGNRCAGKRVIRYMRKKGKDYKEDLQEEIRKVYKSPLLSKEVEVELDLYFPDKRKRDLDNYNKVILDALEDTILVDDKQIKRLCITKYSNDEGKIVMRIKEWD